MLLKVLFVLMGLSVLVPFIAYHATGKRKGKECLLMNIISYFGLFAIASISMFCGAPAAFAAGEAAGET